MSKNIDVDIFIYTIVFGIMLYLVVFSFIDADRIDDIEAKIKDMPQRVCHNETSTKFIELASYMTYIYDDKDIVYCEGRTISVTLFGELHNLENSTNRCVITTTKEVCEIK